MATKAEKTPAPKKTFEELLFDLINEIPEVNKDKEGDTGRRKYKYVSPVHLKRTLRPLLLKHGFYFTDSASGEYFTTKLTHRDSGKFIKATTKVPPFDNPQEIGKFRTFMVRYHRLELLDIITDEFNDDDGFGFDDKDKSKDKINSLRNGLPRT